MSVKPLMTHEIGSLAKPIWRVKAKMGACLSDSDIEEAKQWGVKLKIEHCDVLIHLLKKKLKFTASELEKILFFSSLYALRLQEMAGLDLVWDGEQQRVEMYEYPIKHLLGFTFHGHVRSFENKYYRRATCENHPFCENPYHVNEFLLIKKLAKQQVKIPVTGAYTLVDWSYDSYYLKKIAPGIEGILEKRKEARREFLKDISQQVIYKNLQSLQKAGAKFLQIDEPAATTKRGELDLFLHSLSTSIGDLKQKSFFSLHICYSDYSLLFPQIRELEGVIDELHLEYANRDSKELGRTKDKRTGYKILDHLKKTHFVVGLGVLDSHTDFIESKELVRDRILYAFDKIQDPTRLMVAPDCGLRTRTWDIAYQKLTNMVEGTHLAKKELGLI